MSSPTSEAHSPRRSAEQLHFILKAEEQTRSIIVFGTDFDDKVGKQMWQRWREETEKI